MAWRIIESAGVGAGTAAVVGLMLVPILVWRGQPATTPAIALLALGAAAGALFGVLHRPRLLHTALEADRQLGLHDLLSTVMMMSDRADDSLTAAVLACADDRCRQLSPEALILRRLGSRAWGGVGIASALLLTISLMSSQPSRTIAQARAQTGREDLHAIIMSRAAEQGRSGLTAAPQATEGPRRGETAAVEDKQADEGGASGREHSGEIAPRASSAPDDAAGAGSGRTRDASTPALAQRSSEALPGQSDGAVAGGGAAARDGTGAGTSTGVTGTTGGPSRRAPPWRSPTWAADRAAAMQAIGTGRVPDAYRDLVREYFDHTEP